MIHLTKPKSYGTLKPLANSRRQPIRCTPVPAEEQPKPKPEASPSEKEQEQ